MLFNKYLSTIEDLKLDSYPLEVQDEFYEALTVPFISRLISIDRPFCSLLERDSEGKAKIDITNPPIIENVDYFRPTAVTFKKTGKMCPWRINSNPNSDFGKWLKEEIRRIWEGYIRTEDGAYVTGDLYFYLNYTPIIQSKIRPGTKIADRVVDFPEFWEGILYRFLYWEMSRINAHHSAEIAKRGASKSYSVASVLSKIFTVGENRNSCKKVRGLVMAYLKEYLTKDGTLNKFVEMIDFLKENTLLPNARLKESLQDMIWRAGFKDLNTGTARGTLNEILGISSKDDPDKARGKRSSKLIVEEFGNFPRVADTYRVVLPNVLEGDIVFGLIIMIGTGGSEGADFAGAQEIIYHPSGFNIQALPNVYDKSTKGAGESIFFFGAYLNRKGCYNEDGISDVTKAILEICYNRYLVKYNTTDSMALTRTKAENPLTLQEAIMRRDGSIFPVAAITDRINEIESNPNFFDEVLVADLTLKNDGKVLPSLTENLPIRHFPHKDNKLLGAVEIYNMPEKDSSGNVFPQRYIVGHDPVDNDLADSSSLSSTFVFDLFTDSIVAEFTGRRPFAEDNYEIVRLLCIMYNAKALIEANKKGWYAYFAKMNSTHYLAETPLYLRDKQLIKYQSFGSNVYGVNANATINGYARTLLRDWLISPVTITKEIDGEEQLITVPKLTTIKQLALLQELSQWSHDGNYDRVSAMGMVMLYREEKRVLFLGDMSKAAQEFIDKSLPEYDDFFSSNWR